jgi:hypothetical protein
MTISTQQRLENLYREYRAKVLCDPRIAPKLRRVKSLLFGRFYD